MTQKTEKRFYIGVNYWPASKGMRLWRYFDPGEVKEDFARMAEIGLSPVRVFLIWEDFQPEPMRISIKAIDNLVKLATSADDHGIKVWVTFFTGHMSGANWVPPWLITPGGVDTFFPVVAGKATGRHSVGNPYDDAALRGSQKKQIREVCSGLAQHPALWGWDLGNEPSNLFRPAGPLEGEAWIKEMADEIHLLDGSHPITLGIHQGDLEENRGIGPAQVAAHCDTLSIHAYPAYSDWSRGAHDPLFPLFITELAGWLAEGKGAWLTEFGMSTGNDPLSVDEEEAARYAGECLDLLRRYGAPGALWWCFSDYGPQLWDTPPFDRLAHERSFGIFRIDGSPKPVANILASANRSPDGESALPSVDRY